MAPGAEKCIEMTDTGVFDTSRHNVNDGRNYSDTVRVRKAAAVAECSEWNEERVLDMFRISENKYAGLLGHLEATEKAIFRNTHQRCPE